MTPELTAAVEKVLEGFDKGVFIRDISRDHESGWAMKAWPYLVALGKLARAAELAGVQSHAPASEEQSDEAHDGVAPAGSGSRESRTTAGAATAALAAPTGDDSREAQS